MNFSGSHPRWQPPHSRYDALPATLAGRRIARGHRVPFSLADLIADLAGFREAR